MLPDIHLDQITFEDMLEEAKNKIVSCYPEWTDFNYHDPGITLTELFAWHREIQQYEMDQVGDVHRRRYLRLLGTDIRHRTGATAYVSAGADRLVRIPAGTRLEAAGIPFETEEYRTLPGRKIVRCFAMLDGRVVSYLDKDQMLLGRSVEFCPFGRNALPGTDFYLELDGPLPEGEMLGLTVFVGRQKGAARNPAKENTLPLSRFCCSYRDEAGDRPLKIRRDETFGFLFDGQMSFCLDGRMEKQRVNGEEGYFLKIHLEESQYDTPPVVSSLDMNTLKVRQQETVAAWLKAERDAQEPELLRIRHGLCAAGKVRAFALLGECYRELPVSEQSWDEGRGEAGIRLKEAPEKEDIFVLVHSREGWYAKHGVPGSGHGFPNEQFSLEETDVSCRQTELLVEEPDCPGFYRKWERRESFSYSGPEDRHYCVDGAAGRIVFGDGFHGMPPEGRILLTSYVRVRGSGGNIKAHRIQSFTDMSKSYIPVTNPKDAAGGRDEESVQEAFARVRGELAHAGSMVTEEDYERAVLQTPGLRIESCKAVFGPEGPEGEQLVQVVVKPGSMEKRPRLTPAMTENIRRHLEPKRLLGIRIRVLSPVYIRLSVNLEVFVQPQYQEAQELVEHTVREYLSPLLSRFGGTVSYGELYGQIDRLRCVSGIRSLALEAKGNGVRRNTYGDLLLPGNGIADEIEVQCSCSVRG